MSWVAVGTVAVGAISAGVSANAANKRARNAVSGYDDVIAYARDNPEAFGEKLEWTGVDYSPLFRQDPGYAGVASDTIQGSLRNLPQAQQLAGSVNDWITQDARNRINALDPTFASAYEQNAQNTLSLLRGQIPQEDMDAITSRRTEAQSLGGGGVNPQQIAADLGLSRLQLMQQGTANLGNAVNLWETLAPRSSYMLPQSQFVDVGNAVASSIAENQFASQFAQSERNQELAYAMQADPQAAAMVNLLAGRAGLQAANPTQNVGMSALTGAGNAYAGWLAGGGMSRPQTTTPAYPSYVPAPQSSLSQGDFAVGSTTPYTSPYATSFGNNQAFTAPFGGAQNPYTGSTYGDQGGLWSFFQNQNRRGN